MCKAVSGGADWGEQIQVLLGKSVWRLPAVAVSPHPTQYSDGSCWRRVDGLG